MRKAVAIAAAVVCFSSHLLAQTADTTVFRLQLLPENEVPAVPLEGASANATITIRVNRDSQGSIDTATVIFDVSYLMPLSTTFRGLHIHNAPVGTNGPVVINSGLREADSEVGTSGRIRRTVDFSSLDIGQLASVEGLLASPELYYVNLHSTDNRSGVVRGQLLPNVISFSPVLRPENEVTPVIGLDADGAARITVQVDRDPAGTITSGTVTFDVNFTFAGSVSITGLHVHNAAAGSNGSVVINSGVNSTGPLVDSDGKGGIFRVATIDPTDTEGLATLNSLIENPSQFYVNLHTSDNPSGAIRGQLDRNTLSFYARLTGDEEVPSVSTTGTASGLITVAVTRDGGGNIEGGNVEFDLDYSFPDAITFRGLHIHNAAVGANGPVRVNSGISGSSPIVDDDGVGTIIREATIDAGNTSGIEALNGLFVSPDLYYVNLHSVSNPSGSVRSQVGYETYHFSSSLSPASEVPAVVSAATGTAWMSVLVKRDGNGTITSGSVKFDVDFSIGESATITGLHIHSAGAGQNGSVVVNSGASSIVSDTGTGNVFRDVAILSSDTGALNALEGIVDDATGFYTNLHTMSNPSGLMRAQLLESNSFISQIVGGGNWITSVTLTNPSATESVEGIAKFFDTAAMALPEGVIDQTIPFWIPPSGSVTLNTHNQGTLTVGFARIGSDGEVTTQVAYMVPGFTSSGPNTPVTARSVTADVTIGGGESTGVAVLSLGGADILFTLRNASGATIGSSSVTLGALGHYAAFLDEMFSGFGGASMSATLEIESRKGFVLTGSMSIVIVEINPEGLIPVIVNPN